MASIAEIYARLAQAAEGEPEPEDDTLVAPEPMEGGGALERQFGMPDWGEYRPDSGIPPQVGRHWNDYEALDMLWSLADEARQSKAMVTSERSPGEFGRSMEQRAEYSPQALRNEENASHIPVGEGFRSISPEEVMWQRGPDAPYVALAPEGVTPYVQRNNPVPNPAFSVNTGGAFGADVQQSGRWAQDIADFLRLLNIPEPIASEYEKVKRLPTVSNAAGYGGKDVIAIDPRGRGWAPKPGGEKGWTGTGIDGLIEEAAHAADARRGIAASPEFRSAYDAMAWSNLWNNTLRDIDTRAMSYPKTDYAHGLTAILHGLLTGKGGRPGQRIPPDILPTDIAEILAPLLEGWQPQSRYRQPNPQQRQPRSLTPEWAALPELAE